MLLDGRQGKNNKSIEKLKATSTGDMDGNKAPSPTATMDPRTSETPDQPSVQSRPTHNSIGAQSLHQLRTYPHHHLNGQS
jgi:hypothetical protein